MTGYTVHTGTSKKFVSGWDDIFADEPKKSPKKSAKKKASKKPPKSKKKTAVSGKSGQKQKTGKKQAARKPKK